MSTTLGPDSPLAIHILGPLAVRVEDHPLPQLRSHKGKWLLVLLALRHDREVDRSWLAGTLWPESSQTQALSHLRGALTDLRRALGTEVWRLISPTPRTLRLDLSDATVDVFEFDEALARGGPSALTRAVSLYRGPFLEGCTEEWVLPERASRERAYLAALETLAEQAKARGDLPAAIDCLRRAVAADPLRETACRGLIEALAAQGNYAETTQVYRELRETLHREMNVEPAPETTELFRRLRTEAGVHTSRKSPAAIHETPSAAPPPCRLSRPLTPLVGRETGRRAPNLEPGAPSADAPGAYRTPQRWSSRIRC